jgi:hypothetical protein
VTGCEPIVVEKNTPLTPLKRGIKKTPESYPLDKEKNQFKIIYSLSGECRKQIKGFRKYLREYKTLIERKLFRGSVASHPAKRQNRVATKFYNPPQSPFMKGGKKRNPPL